MPGLKDKLRSGRPTIYDETEQAQLKTLIDAHPHQLRSVQAKLAQETGKSASTMTLKCHLKIGGTALSACAIR